MKYLIHGCWRDEKREYKANKIGDKLFIYVAGGWRHAIWVEDNGEGLRGYKCYYPVQRWNPPYLFIRVRYVVEIGPGIWDLQKNKLAGSCAWIDREKLCFKELKNNCIKGYDVQHLNGDLRFKGLGDCLISVEGSPVCAVDVAGVCWDKSESRFMLQAAHKDKLGWVEDMNNKGILPVYAFFLSKKLLSKKYNYIIINDWVIDHFFKTKKGSVKKFNIDFTKNNLWGDNKIPTTPTGWFNINPYFLTVKGLYNCLKR